MTEPTTGRLLRIFVDEADRLHGQPLYTAIVEALRHAGFIGATVLKGIEGYGAHKTVRSARTFDFSTNLPVIVEVIDEAAKIDAFLPTLETMIGEGLLTLENVTLIRLKKGGD